MALPSNSFMFNYNAKNYDAVTHTFYKTPGQLFDEDLTLNTAPASYTDTYVNFGTTRACTGRTGYTTSNNPFTRNSSNPTLTFIYKTSGWTTNTQNTNLFSNRHPNNSYNWWVRDNCVGGFISNCPNYNPQICITRVNSDGSAIRKFVDVNGNLMASASTGAMTYYNYTPTGFGFFAGYAEGTNEWFNKTFYWMYCSLEALTDEEITKVIKYNEGIVDFSISPDLASFQSSGGSSAITVTSESNWSASTNNNWITVSPSSGTSAATSCTISTNVSLFSDRNGTVTFTDGENTAELTVTQSGVNKVPYNNLFRGGNRIN